jgi:hypothetical protein
MRMRGWAAAAVVLLPCGSALAAPAAGGHQESAVYSGPAGVADVYRMNGYAQGQRQGAVELLTRKGDRTAVVTAADDAGRPVRLEIAQDLSGRGFVTDIASYCSDEAPVLRLARGGVPLQVYVVAGMCGTALSIPTEGKIEGAFS